MPAKKKTAGESGETQNTAGESSGVEYVRKLSPKTVAKKIEPGVTAIVAGTVRSAETVTSTYGDSLRFRGDFAMRTHEGGTVKAGQLFLPGIAEDALSNALDNREDRGEPLEFSFRIGAVENSNSKTGYEWVMKPVREPSSGEDRTLQLLEGKD